MLVWKILLFMMFLPVAFLFHLFKLLAGREKAIRVFYKFIADISAKILSLAIPTLLSDQSFSRFSQKMKKSLFLMPFEIIEVIEETDKRFQIKVTRCQFVEVFSLLGMSTLTKALCDGDVLFCERYQPALRFERTKTLESGDDCCNHTFIIKEKGQKNVF